MPTEHESFCRVCGSELFDEPLLCYANMPGAAQDFPTAATLKQDSGTNLEVCQCASCGLVQLRNAPVSYYREVIRAAAFSEAMKAFRRRQFRSWVAKYHLKGKKILEVGCGRGEYLSLLKECAVDAHGLEYAASSVVLCQNQGLSVSQGFPGQEDHGFPHAPFDAFACLNFLEHWPDPNAVLRGIRANVRDGGIGLVEVPNFDMVVRKGLFSEFVADHLLYFDRQTLSFTLKKNGFEVLECAPVWHEYILSAVVKKLVRTDCGVFERCRENMTNELDAFLSRMPTGRVAVWGAGHQALAVLSLANLGSRICYVVDSAPFKQGKYTPATHLPIVSPETLASDPVDAVIVMAASYSDEVACMLRASYKDTIQVAIVRDCGVEIV